MEMELTTWQKRLGEHFSSLCENRKREASGHPTFVLEHGLTGAEGESLSAAIRRHIMRDTPKWEHRLVWIVYASEFGYAYSGEEYWPTFSAETPGWLFHGDRHWIRRCFK